MAYTFDGSTQLLENATVPLSAWPMSMSIWCNTSAASDGMRVLSITNTGATNPLNELYAAGNTNKLICQSRGAAASNSAATSTGTWTDSVWFHAGGRIASDGDTTVFLNGTATTGNSITDTMAAVNVITIGALKRTTTSNYFNGTLAEAAIWNIALEDSDYANLADGLCPLFVRPHALVFYAPIVNALHERVQGLTLTNTNSATVAAHPRIIYPRHRKYRFTAAAGGGLFKITGNPRSLAGFGGGLAA